MTIVGKGEESDRDWKVERNDDHFTVTDIATGNETQINLNNFEFGHNSLIRMDINN